MIASSPAGSSRKRWLSPDAAAAQTNVGRKRLFSIAYHGGFKVKISGGNYLFEIDERWRAGTDIYDDYVRGITVWDHQHVYSHKRIRLAARVPSSYAWPERLDEFFLQNHSCESFTTKLLQAYFIFPCSGRADHKDRLVAKAISEFETPRRHVRRGECGLPLALERFPDLKLPDTIATDDEFGEIDHKWLWSAMSCMNIAKLACAAQIYIGGSEEYRVARLGRGLEFLDAKLTEIACGTPITANMVSQALTSILTDATNNEAGKNVRVEGVRSIISVLRGMRIYRARHPDRLRDIAHLFDITISQDVELRARLRKLEINQRNKFSKNRKENARYVSNNFSDYLISVCSRAFEAEICAAQVQTAMPRALEHFASFDADQCFVPFYEFYAALPVADEEGLPITAARQLCRLRIWREGDLWASLSRDDDTMPSWSGLQGAEKRRFADSSLEYDGLVKQQKLRKQSRKVIVEYLECVPDVGGHISEPHFVTPYRLGVLMGSDRCPPHLRERKSEYIKNGLRTFVPGPLGPLGWGREMHGLAYWSARLGRCLIPIEGFALGMRIAHCAISIVADSLARRMELLQLQQTSASMRCGIGPAGRSYGFMAVPKGAARPAEFIISEETFLKCNRIARDLACAAGYSDEYLRKVTPGKNLPRRLRSEGPYIFQWNRRFIAAYTLNFLVALLSVGFGKVTLHIIRHAASNHLNQHGAVIEVIQELLKHQDQWMSKYYSKATPEQIAREQADKDEQQVRAVRHADARRKSSKVPL